MRWLIGRCVGKSRKLWPISVERTGTTYGQRIKTVRVSGAMHGYRS